MQSKNDALKEESIRLDQTIKEIDKQLGELRGRYYGDNYLEQVLDFEREQSRERLKLLQVTPYFGRIDFEEKGHELERLYIGKRGMEHSANGRPFVIDWRAPVASLFYSFTGGDESVSYEAPEGTITGEVHRKRNLAIEEGKLERVVDSYVRGGDNLGVSDEFLLHRLEDRKDNRLRDIVATIQSEQDLIIRAPRGKALIIQGAAGSGKTTVALHRLAFLLYQYQDQIRAEKMVILAPSAMFLDYISGVLPELGVGDVRQTTFADWSLDLLGAGLRLATNDVDSKQFARNTKAKKEGRGKAVASKKAMEPAESFERIKGSLRFKQLLAQRLAAWTSQFLASRGDMEAWQGGPVLGMEQIQYWFNVEYQNYLLGDRKERLIARMNRWLEMALDEIADPKIRKERSKVGKQRLRAYTKALPQTDVLSVYLQLLAMPEESLRDLNNLPVSLCEEIQKNAKQRRVMRADLPALVYLHFALYRVTGHRLDHIVIDEAQDISPFQVEVLRSCMNEPSFTILGDLAQGIHDYRGIHRWEELSCLFSEEELSYHELRQSYRSTLEIITFANQIIPHTETNLPPAIPVFRSGESVRLMQLASASDAQVEQLQQLLKEFTDKRMKTIAFICRTEEACVALHKRLSEAQISTSLIVEGQQDYTGGVSIVPVHLSKGLEFDAVILPDADVDSYTASPHHAKLLYVACTRALHMLALLYDGELSPLVNSSLESESSH